MCDWKIAPTGIPSLSHQNPGYDAPYLVTFLRPFPVATHCRVLLFSLFSASSNFQPSSSGRSLSSGIVIWIRFKRELAYLLLPCMTAGKKKVEEKPHQTRLLPGTVNLYLLFHSLMRLESFPACGFTGCLVWHSKSFPHRIGREAILCQDRRKSHCLIWNSVSERRMRRGKKKKEEDGEENDQRKDFRFHCHWGYG